MNKDSCELCQPLLPSVRPADGRVRRRWVDGGGATSLSPPRLPTPATHKGKTPFSPADSHDTRDSRHSYADGKEKVYYTTAEVSMISLDVGVE